ncbi:hypothetical protein sscle_01g010230 [Sclerotinia sclerotiorum 1980 UF-70]|uniref:Uncharacterized protein n=1 Tax=Sclerotinia sclerotiorum (strain ATCC 18683 / 1980 / Ss-1) TaxID=665079 RepID=A0A1D9PVD7_SCLS1|nr:hypothetical protein sscle_01g010230 [Sclerotinia sclerotiorum 1980 UF-70]
MSSEKSSSSKISYAQRPSKLAEDTLEKTQGNIDDRLHLIEKRERERMVVLAFNQWKQKYPRQCNQLDCEASYHEVDEEYDGTDGNNTEAVHVHWQEGETKGAHETEGKGGKPPATFAMKTRREKVAKRIADAKKAMRFGSVAAEEKNFPN